MSKGGNHNGTFVDTGLLRDHVSKLREQRKTAVKLYENVRMMKQLADPAEAYQYDSILRNVNQLIEYFDRMSKVLAEVEDDAIVLSHRIKALIQEDADRAHHEISKAILL